MALTNSDLLTLIEFKAFCRDDCAEPVDLVRLRHDGTYAARLLARLEKLGKPALSQWLQRVRPLASGASGAAPPLPAEKYRGSLR